MIISVERCEKATNKHGFRCLQVAVFLWQLAIKAFWNLADMTAMVEKRFFLRICNI